jgi:hypothetical protein
MNYQSILFYTSDMFRLTAIFSEAYISSLYKTLNHLTNVVLKSSLNTSTNATFNCQMI